MISFFCTRCGAALETDDDRAGQPVRCATCSKVLLAPEAANQIPFARLAAPSPEDLIADIDAANAETEIAKAADNSDAESIAAEVLGLEYGIGSYPPRGRFRNEAALDEMAERLNRIDAGDPAAETGMTECRVCGSTIAGFVRKCPFCRNSLVGRA